MNRLRYFELAGYRVAALFIRADLAMSASDWRRQLSGNLGSYNFERVFVTCADSEAISRTGAFSLDGDLSAFLCKEQPQCVYLGAVACFPLLQALELDDAAVISEADSVLAYEDEHNFGELALKEIDDADNDASVDAKTLSHNCFRPKRSGASSRARARR